MQIIAENKVRGHKIRFDFDTGESYEIDRTVVAENCLHKGEIITPERLREIIDLSQKKQAQSRAVWYLSRSDCSKGEMLSKLKRAGFSSSAAEHAVAKLCEYGMLDDEKYAARLAENYKLRNLSPKESVAKIISKRINAEIAKQAVAALEYDERESIKILVERKYRQKLNDAKGRQAVFGALCRKGFSIEDIRSVLREYDNSDENFF